MSVKTRMGTSSMGRTIDMPRRLHQRIERLTTATAGTPDWAFIAFGSPEARCLGAASRFHQYKAGNVCILRISDETNDEREANISILQDLCRPVGNIFDCPMKHEDPLFGIDTLLGILDHAKAGATVTIDISTFPRNALLIVLRALSKIKPSLTLRLVYTEPGAYKMASGPVSYGLSRIEVVPTYSAPYNADQELVLVIFLGFERDRVLGLWQCVAPHKTIVVIADPPYRPEWTGVSEHINAALLAGLPESNVHL